MAKRPASSQTTTAGSACLSASSGAMVRTTMPAAMMQTRPEALPGQTYLHGHPTPAGAELRAQPGGQSLAQFAPAPGEGEHHDAARPPPLPVHQRYSWEKAAS